MIDLSGSAPAWPPHAAALWAECAAKAVSQTDLWTVPAPRGDEILREAIASRLGFDAEHVTIVASLRAAALTYARRFSRLAVERPTYPGILPVLSAAGGEVSLHPWPELLDERLRLPGQEATVLWLTSPGRNPDGATLSPADRRALRRRLDQGHRVVVNATYAWFAGPGYRPPEGVDVVGSLHKLRGVGSRLGWVLSPRYFAEAFPELLGTTPSRVWQRAWGLFLQGDGMELLEKTLIGETLAAAAAFRAHLNLPAFDGPSTLIPLAAGADEDKVLAELEGKGFRLVAGRHFHTDRPALRATFTGVTADEAVRFATALVALAGTAAGTGGVALEALEALDSRWEGR